MATLSLPILVAAETSRTRGHITGGPSTDYHLRHEEQSCAASRAVSPRVVRRVLSWLVALMITVVIMTTSARNLAQEGSCGARFVRG